MVKRILSYFKRRNLKREYKRVKRSERAILTLMYEYKQVNGPGANTVLVRMLLDERKKLDKFRDEDFFSEKIIGIYE